jgi:hypothetical protein
MDIRIAVGAIFRRKSAFGIRHTDMMATAGELGSPFQDWLIGQDAPPFTTRSGV